jgi:DNA mismatch repair protein MutL
MTQMNTPVSRRIHFLPEQLANQIAAGEVVERPASVLKELLENALDAGASQIDVEVERGGTGLIRVRDNGGGIHKEDMAMAVSRHATSKIASLEDLEALISLGFRGEALASIGSVSRLKLVSATAGAETAWSVEAQGRDSQPREFPASHPVGTSVEVAELFFNTPARRKFLRTEKTEFAHIEDVFKRAALSRFEVGFSLTHNRRRLYRLRPAQSSEQKRQRIAEVCGKAFSQTALAVDESLDKLHLEGWIAPASEGRSSSDTQYFFLNGRMVRDKLIQHAIRQAYDELLPVGRHAAYVLYLAMPVAEVDVNVHPTKHEVRFHQARRVHDFLVVALRRALEQRRELPLAMNEPAAPAYQRPPTPSAPPAEPFRPRPLASVPRQPPLRQEADAEQKPFTLGQPIAQVDDRYLLLQGEEGVSLLDIVEADRLLALAGLERQWRSQRPGQPLIFPAQVALDTQQRQRLESLRSVLEPLGIAWDELTEGRIVLRSLPEVLHPLDLERWLKTVLEAVEPSPLEDIEQALPVLAAAAAQSRRYRPSQGEMGSLLQSLQQLNLAALEGKLWRRLDADTLQQIMKGKA